MNMRYLLLSLCMGLLSSPLSAQTYLYNARCDTSYFKQEVPREPEERHLQAIRCDFITLTLTDEGQVILQIVDTDNQLSPLGFGGGKMDFEVEAGRAVVHLKKAYILDSSLPKPMPITEDVEGSCTLDGRINIRHLYGISCDALLKTGKQALRYRIKTEIKSVGQIIPNLM